MRRRRRRRKRKSPAQKRDRIRRMLRVMRARDTGRGERAWSVYLLECRGGSLYTGIAKDPAARFAAHQAGKGAAFTRINPPLRLLYREDGYTRSQALVREAAIKAWPRPRKLALAAAPVHRPTRMPPGTARVAP